MNNSFLLKTKKKLYPYIGKPYRYIKDIVKDYRTNPDARYRWHRIRMYAPALDSRPVLSERAAILDEYALLARENGKKISSDNITDSYYDLEIESNTILMVGLGKNIRGNLQYILSELNTSEKYRNFSMYVRTSDETDHIVQEYIRQNGWTRTYTVPKDKPYQRLLESAKYLITEVYFPEGWVKKPGQTLVSIWHGTPLKKLGLAKNAKNHHNSGVVQKNFIDADYLLYPNEYTREKMLASYKVSQLMTGKTFLLGYPRTGGMIAGSLSEPEKIRGILAPNGEKLYAYMPTFRDFGLTEDSVALAKDLLDYLDQHLRPDQLLYVNLHHRLNDSIDYSTYRRIRKFPPTVDSYRLLGVSDALISDYSSVFMDYLALRKQIILYIPDYKEYCQKRGMYTDLLAFPFDKAYTCEEVLAALNRGKQYDDTATFREFCPNDSPDSAKLLCNLFQGITDGLTLEDIPKNDKVRALLYSDAMQPGRETEFLRMFTAWYDKAKREIYLSCNMEKTDENRNYAYPMLSRSPVIGASNTLHLSSLGQAARDLYLEGKIDFTKAIECLKYDYSVNLQRIYGRARFDSVVIYDSDDPDMILTLVQSPASKVMLLQHRTIDQILSGNQFLRDAVCYASRFCRAVLVFTSSDRDLAKSILDKAWAKKIQIIVTPYQMNAAVFPNRK